MLPSNMYPPATFRVLFLSPPRQALNEQTPTPQTCGAWGNRPASVLEAVDDFRRAHRLIIAVTPDQVTSTRSRHRAFHMIHFWQAFMRTFRLHSDPFGGGSFSEACVAHAQGFGGDCAQPACTPGHAKATALYLDMQRTGRPLPPAPKPG